jgi:hypothetical protein
VSFAAIILCVASQRVIPKVSVYFVIDSVRKLLDTPAYAIPIELMRNKRKVDHHLRRVITIITKVLKIGVLITYFFFVNFNLDF